MDQTEGPAALLAGLAMACMRCLRHVSRSKCTRISPGWDFLLAYLHPLFVWTLVLKFKLTKPLKKAEILWRSHAFRAAPSVPCVCHPNASFSFSFLFHGPKPSGQQKPCSVQTLWDWKGEAWISACRSSKTLVNTRAASCNDLPARSWVGRETQGALHKCFCASSSWGFAFTARFPSGYCEKVLKHKR